MCYEATRNLPLEEAQVETPGCPGESQGAFPGRKLAIVPILRAGLGMVDGVLALIPSAKVGHIGLYRENPETLNPVEYYCKIAVGYFRANRHDLRPDVSHGRFRSAAIQFIKGYECKSIKP
jgi:uracil phosphoribosyltransferase